MMLPIEKRITTIAPVEPNSLDGPTLFHGLMKELMMIRLLLNLTQISKLETPMLKQKALRKLISVKMITTFSKEKLIRNILKRVEPSTQDGLIHFPGWTREMMMIQYLLLCKPILGWTICFKLKEKNIIETLEIKTLMIKETQWILVNMTQWKITVILNLLINILEHQHLTPLRV